MKSIEELREWRDFSEYFGSVYHAIVLAGGPLPEFFVADSSTFRRLTRAITQSFEGNVFSVKHEWLSNNEIKLFFPNAIPVSVKQLAYCDKPTLLPVAFPKE